MRRLFLLTFSFFLILWVIYYPPSEAPPPSFLAAADDVINTQKIDGEIQELEQMKRGYEARALRYENMVEYLQFETEAVLETRRYLQLAEENRNKAALVQKQIDILKAKRGQKPD